MKNETVQQNSENTDEGNSGHIRPKKAIHGIEDFLVWLQICSGVFQFQICNRVPLFNALYALLVTDLKVIHNIIFREREI